MDREDRNQSPQTETDPETLVAPEQPELGQPPERPPATVAAREREARLHGMDWAKHNLGIDSPRELSRTLRIGVFEAPGTPAERKVISLRNGRVDTFHEQQHRPTVGWYADYADVQRHCLDEGLAFEEVEGFVNLLPHGSREAGDPLAHPGR